MRLRSRARWIGQNLHTKSKVGLWSFFGWVLELEANKIGENSQVSNYHRKKAPIGYIKNRYAEINLGGKNSPQKWQLWEGLLLLMFLYKTSNPPKKLFFSCPYDALSKAGPQLRPAREQTGA